MIMKAALQTNLNFQHGPAWKAGGTNVESLITTSNNNFLKQLKGR
jgi:hypothetical protein